MTDEGFVPTPRPITDWVVAKLFVTAPSADDTVLLPGCGTGQFAAAIERYCSYRGHECPEIHAVESNSERADQFVDRFQAVDKPHRPQVPEESAEQLRCTYPPSWSPSHSDVSMTIHLHRDDFLLNTPGVEFDYIVANPPFVKYNTLDREKREQYSEAFETAQGRFNLYAPFVERMCDLLDDGGELRCILPDQFLFSRNSRFRRRLREETIHEVRPLPEAVFPNHDVRSCLLSLSADPSLGLNGSFAITSWHYRFDVEQLLQRLGVPKDALKEQVTAYTERRQGLQETLRARRRRNGKDSGYNAAVDPRLQTDTAIQSDLGNWA
ncbi:Eco57I restriction-modification methylase domain-containing protein [Haloarcula marismortui]|uniref:Eco57I restriction-modification methylase domain-containing protein n=1 Tax=Haloarcula marismortui TaxID=2238 RepID=UPI0009B5B0C3|nr:N-6 DNA methylase [Haloarcula californiae]